MKGGPKKVLKAKISVLDPKGQDFSEEAGERPAGGGKGTILLVDDDELVQKLGALLLRQMGFEVSAARNGREALDVFRRSGGAFRCVILDLVMPVMDGAATLEALRLAAPHMPVIMCSAYGLEEVARLCAFDSWTSVVEKPFEFSTFSAAVLAALKSAER